MKQLQTIVESVLANMASSGKLNSIIEEQVVKAVDSVMDDCFGYGSKFRPGLKKHIEDTLKIDFEDLGLEGYNAMLIKIIRQKLDARFEGKALADFSKELDEVLRQPPAEIKITELVDKLREERRNDGDFSEDDEISVRLEESTGSDGYYHLYLDPKPGKRRSHSSEFEYHLAVTPKGEVYGISGRWAGDLTKKIFAGPFFGFARQLFQLHAAKVKLINDWEN